MTIDVGLYKTRAGVPAQVTETGSFAYGAVAGRAGIWTMEGEYVSGLERRAVHPLDLVERVRTLGDRVEDRLPLCPDSPDGLHHAAPIGCEEDLCTVCTWCYYCGEGGTR